MAELIAGSTVGGVSIASKNDVKKVHQLVLVGPLVDVAVLNGVGYFVVPDEYTGMNLIRCAATVVTAGVTGLTTIGIYNLTDTVEMLSTNMTIDSGETSTRTAVTPAVIDTTKDDVLTGDILRIDVKGVSGTAPKGLIVELVFQTP